MTPPARSIAKLRVQRGLTLLELLVGMTIGVVVGTAAMGTLVFVQTSNRLIGEVARMQQDAAIAFHLIGQHVLSAGSIQLTQTADGSVTLTPVTSFNGLNNDGVRLEGLSDREFRIAINLLDPAPVGQSTSDCLGREVLGPILITQFSWENNELRCVGAQIGETVGAGGVTRQAVISNVAQWVVHYGIRSTDRLQYRTYAADLPWAQVVALRVCMVLTSEAAVEDFHALYRDTEGLAFEDCHPPDPDDGISGETIAADPKHRLYRTYRQVFTIRPDSV